VIIFLWRNYFNYSANVSAPFVGTEPKIVKRMLDIAKLNKNDLLYDLGSGDGRIVISSALKGVNSVGIELDPLKVVYSRIFIRLLRLSKKAKIIRGNFFQKDFSSASVVTIFLLHDTNQDLKEKFQNELKSGTRIVSYSFVLEGWKPEKIYHNKDSNWGPIYLYKVK
jgi:cyclopropane fatty-acyl-phospholipid synthase-like methyltransferase